jgi:hypothetical protein
MPTESEIDRLLKQLNDAYLDLCFDKGTMLRVQVTEVQDRIRAHVSGLEEEIRQLNEAVHIIYE